MGFFAGRLTFARYRVTGPAPRLFGPQHLERLAAHAIGTQRDRFAGRRRGRLDRRRPHPRHPLRPGQEHRQRDAAASPCASTSRRSPPTCCAPTPRSSCKPRRPPIPAAGPAPARTARPATPPGNAWKTRPSDGRFLSRKAYPILWDAPSNELLVGTTSMTVIDRLHTLFQQTFGRRFELLTAGRQAFRLAEARQPDARRR